MSYVLSLVVVATVCLTVLAQLCIRHRRVAVRSGSKASVWRSVGHFRSAPVKRHSGSLSACLKGAIFGSGKGCDKHCATHEEWPY